jgi:hypothetical protein
MRISMKLDIAENYYYFPTYYNFGYNWTKIGSYYMKTYIQFLCTSPAWLAEYLSQRKLFRIKIEEKSRTSVIYAVQHFSSVLLF